MFIVHLAIIHRRARRDRRVNSCHGRGQRYFFKSFVLSGAASPFILLVFLSALSALRGESKLFFIRLFFGRSFLIAE